MASLYKVLVPLVVLCSLTASVLAQGGTAPDLTGNSRNPGQGFQSGPDLTGKSSNAMFTENGRRMRSGQGPDLTGRVQEEKRSTSGTQANSSDSSANLAVIALVLVALALTGGAVVYMQKSK